MESEYESTFEQVYSKIQANHLKKLELKGLFSDQSFAKKSIKLRGNNLVHSPLSWFTTNHNDFDPTELLALIEKEHPAFLQYYLCEISFGLAAAGKSKAWDKLYLKYAHQDDAYLQHLLRGQFLGQVIHNPNEVNFDLIESQVKENPFFIKCFPSALYLLSKRKRDAQPLSSQLENIILNYFRDIDWDKESITEFRQQFFEGCQTYRLFSLTFRILLVHCHKNIPKIVLDHIADMLEEIKKTDQPLSGKFELLKKVVFEPYVDICSNNTLSEKNDFFQKIMNHFNAIAIFSSATFSNYEDEDEGPTEKEKIEEIKNWFTQTIEAPFQPGLSLVRLCLKNLKESTLLQTNVFEQIGKFFSGQQNPCKERLENFIRNCERLISSVNPETPLFESLCSKIAQEIQWCSGDNGNSTENDRFLNKEREPYRMLLNNIVTKMRSKLDEEESSEKTQDRIYCLKIPLV